MVDDVTQNCRWMTKELEIHLEEVEEGLQVIELEDYVGQENIKQFTIVE